MTRTVLATLLLILVSVAKAAGGDVPADRELSLGMPTFKVTVPREDWAIDVEKHRPDGSGAHYQLTSKQRDVVFSFYIEKTMPCKTSAACRDLALTNPAYKDAKDVKLSDQGGYSVAQFKLERPMGFPVNQAHLLASAFVNGNAVDIHMSRIGKETPDSAPFYALLNDITYRSYANYRVADRGTLALPVDPGWESIKPPADSGASIALASKTPNSFLLMMTPIPVATGKSVGDGDVRARVEHAAADSAPQSVEKSLPFVAIAGPEARGYMFHATDSAPGPGEYRLMYQGTVAIDSLLVTFTVLYNDGADRDAKSALESIRSMHFVPSKN